MGINPESMGKGKVKDDHPPSSGPIGRPNTSIYGPEQIEQTVYTPTPQAMKEAVGKQNTSRSDSHVQPQSNSAGRHQSTGRRHDSGQYPMSGSRSGNETTTTHQSCQPVDHGRGQSRHALPSRSRTQARSGTSGQRSTNHERSVVSYPSTQHDPQDPGYGMILLRDEENLIGGGSHTERANQIYLQKYLPGVWRPKIAHSENIVDWYIGIRRTDQSEGGDNTMETPPHPNPARLPAWYAEDIRFDRYEPRAPTFARISTEPHYFELPEVETLLYQAIVSAGMLGGQGHRPVDICPAYAAAGQYNEDWSKWQDEGTITLTTMGDNIACAIAAVFSDYVGGNRFIICPRKMMLGGMISWDLIDVDRFQITRGQQLPPPALMRGWFAPMNYKYELSEVEREQHGDIWKEEQQQHFQDQGFF